MLDQTFWTLAIVAGAALVAFFILLLIDGILDFMDAPVVQAVLIGVAGGAGTVMVFRGLGFIAPFMAGAIGLVAGAIFMVIFLQVVKAARKSAHDGRQIDFTTLPGSIVSPIWWNGETGDVLVDVSGQRIKVAAEALETIPRETPMEIADFVEEGDKLVKVLLRPAELEEV